MGPHAYRPNKLNINGPPVLNTPSQLGAGPLSKARCSIVGLEGLYPGTPSGTVVEDTDTQEAPDDIRECLHGLMHTRLSMCMLGLSWGKWSDAPASRTPAVAVITIQNGHAITSVGLLWPIPVLCDIFTLFPSCLFLQKRVYPEEVELVKSMWLDPRGVQQPSRFLATFFFF